MKDSGEELAIEVVRKLQHAGHVAYFAGGCVRDRLMGREPKDFDVATSAHPVEVLNLFPRGQQVGAAFGVILVKRGKAQVEVATFRSDGQYSDGRRPDSVTFTTAEKDASRRDFTCNAIFFDPIADTHFDFVGGKADIEAKLLRAVGDPAQRFAEDHLRMMRAVRFAAKLGFEIEPATFAAIKEHGRKISSISKERVGEELRMMLEHPSRSRAVDLLFRTELLYHIWPPNLIDRERPYLNLGQMEGHYILAPGDMSRAVAIAALQMSVAFPAASRSLAYSEVAELLQSAFALSNYEAADIQWMLEAAKKTLDLDKATRAPFKRLIADRRWSAFWDFFRVDQPNEWRDKVEKRIAEMQAEGASPEPFITGDDLIKLGAQPGRQFKGWLESLYDRQLELEFATRDEAIVAAKELIAKGSGLRFGLS
jgi:poly(A) polymerase